STPRALSFYPLIFICIRSDTSLHCTVSSGSSCQEAMARCEAADECRWHLGELRVRCAPSSCRRAECSALQRFARFVPFALVESMMFCHCSAGDLLCTQQQEIIYPKCLYSTSPTAVTCTEAVRKCDEDLRCRHLRHSLATNCPVERDACAETSLDECRRTILNARASVLEQPCYCPLSDVECMGHQRVMIPSNPCIEKAMLDYSRLMGYNTIAANTKEPDVKWCFCSFVVKIVSLFRKRKEKPRTTLSPVSTEPPPPWVTTTEKLAITTVPFVTHAPPPKGLCGSITFIIKILERYVDWSARCSSWCECIAEDELICERLPCLEDGKCEAPLATVDFGERLFLRDRGACFCESSTFICDFPEELPELYPGLYLSAGYSTADVDMLRSEVPHDVLERAGFLSSNAATDIAGRLQVSFERLLPKGLLCRIVLMPEMSEPGSAFMRVEWFGKNMALNHSRTQWHTGGPEKVCSPYAIKLSDYFSLSESPRFQLVLSTVKQLKVLDHLDGLPSSSPEVRYCLIVLPLLLNVLL
uniref:GDNF domain-containing protein n=1 Tax=Angiostrongylus cantonensis TaxID=6313 RepID=A0A158P7T7_ANGCA